MTTTTNVGDPLGHPGFVRGEEEAEEGEEVGEGCYVSDSEDDDDVDRYVFLARKPVAPAEASDDGEDDGAMPPGGGGGEGGGCGRKRHHSEILAHAPPAAKKARRLGLAAPAPRGASADESEGEGSMLSAERGDLDLRKKNTKRRRCGGEPRAESAARGKRSNGVDPEASQASQHWHVMAAAAAAGEAPRRFPCSICGRSFGSYQALGGHVHLGHRKKAKPAIAASSHGDVTVAMADGVGHGKEKTAVVASPAESDGDGTNTLGNAACRQDVDSSSGDSNSNDGMFIDSAKHRGDGNVEGESHDDADGNGNGAERKAAVGRCHELAAIIGNGNSAVRKTQYSCGVCGQEYPSGKALGGHMRKHRKLSPHDGGKERRSLEVADGAGHGQDKTAVAASPWEFFDVYGRILKAFHQDVDSSSGDSNSNEEIFTDAADYGDHHSDGNVEGKKVTVATIPDDAFGNGNGTERKVAGIGNGNGVVLKTQYNCGVCGQEYPSGKALGGHMRKHRKLSPHDGGKARRSPEATDGAIHCLEKTAVAASPGESDGVGNKALNAATCHQDVDSSGDSNEEDMFIGAAKHGDAHGTERKVAVGRCHELAATAIGNVNSIARKTQYRCEVCGKECPSGQALGGHMRKHRKRSPDDDGGKARISPEVISQPKNPQYGNRFDGGMVGWL